MTYFHTKLRMPNSNDSLSVAIKAEAKYNEHFVWSPFIYLKQQDTSTQVGYFYKICYHTLIVTLRTPNLTNSLCSHIDIIDGKEMGTTQTGWLPLA
jgi:hypothetical protein